MAKRELSSTLKGLKFMQRTKVKEEEKAVEEMTGVQVDGAFRSSASVSRKCIVIMEGNPHPGAVKGRMSFQSFNPSIDKLNQEAVGSCIPKTTSTLVGQDDGVSGRMEDSLAASPKHNVDVDLKRKLPDMDLDKRSHHNSEETYKEGNGQSSQEKKRRGFTGQQKQEGLDWNVLRRAKVEHGRG